MLNRSEPAGADNRVNGVVGADPIERQHAEVGKRDAADPCISVTGVPAMIRGRLACAFLHDLRDSRKQSTLHATFQRVKAGNTVGRGNEGRKRNAVPIILRVKVETVTASVGIQAELGRLRCMSGSGTYCNDK